MFEIYLNSLESSALFNIDFNSFKVLIIVAYVPKLFRVFTLFNMYLNFLES